MNFIYLSLFLFLCVRVFNVRSGIKSVAGKALSRMKKKGSVDDRGRGKDGQTREGDVESMKE